jgi:hypothetical protein
MRGIGIFLVVTVTSILVTSILLTWCILSLGLSLTDASRIQMLVSALALVLGTAGAFAGAVASLRVAGLGLTVSERQARSDAIQFLEGRFSRSTDIFAKVILACGNLYAAGILVENAVPAFDVSPEDLVDGVVDSTIRKLFNTGSPEPLKAEIGYLGETIEALVGAIEALAQDEFSLYCFRVAAASQRGWLREIEEELHDTRQAVSLESLAEITSILQVLKRRLRDEHLGGVLSARVAANTASTPQFGGFDYDNRAVRSLMFLGNLLLYRIGKLPDGRTFVASYGAALLRDMIRSIPDGASIDRALGQRYPHLSFALPELKSEFDPASLSSSSLSLAISDAEKIGRLHLLVSQEISAPTDF